MCGLMTYQAFGLTVRSNASLPMLTSGTPNHSTDLMIELGTIPTCPPDSIAIKQHAHINNSQVWLSFSGDCHFWIDSGRMIRTSHSTKQRYQDWCFYLLGAAFMSAVSQRGCLPLHACAFLINNKAILVVGKSGSGKSTLALGIDSLGIPVLSDDMCVVHRNDSGTDFVSFAFPYAKHQSPPSWLDSSQPLWSDNDNQRDKNFYALDTPVPYGQFPVSALYELEHGDYTLIEPHSPVEATRVIYDHTQRRRLFQAIQGPEKHFQWCHGLATKIPAFRFTRHYHRELFASQLQLLIEHAAGQAGL